MTSRIQSFEEFWPHYLGEHRHPTSRRLHFLGTTSFVAACAVSTLQSPVRFPLALCAFGAMFAHGLSREKHGRPLAHVAALRVAPCAVAPITFPAGVVAAYACAWVGHFQIEGNRPATFQYPLWSLAADFRMWSHMLRGQLWSGDPLEELGLAGTPAPSPVPR